MTVSKEKLQEMQEKGFDIEILEENKIKVKNPAIGVPITFLDKHNPEQFEIVVFRKGNDGKDLTYSDNNETPTDVVHTHTHIPYFRIIVRKK